MLSRMNYMYGSIYICPKTEMVSLDFDREAFYIFRDVHDIQMCFFNIIIKEWITIYCSIFPKMHQDYYCFATHESNRPWSSIHKKLNDPKICNLSGSHCNAYRPRICGCSFKMSKASRTAKIMLQQLKLSILLYCLFPCWTRIAIAFFADLFYTSLWYCWFW